MGNQKAAPFWIALVASLVLFHFKLGFLPCLAQVNSDQLNRETQAQDIVTYGPAAGIESDPWNPPTSKQLIGQVIELNADSLIYLTDEGKKRTLPSDRVERIEVAWDSDLAAQAHDRFVRGDYRAALKENPAIIRSGLATWQQRLLIGELIESAEGIGESKLAGSLFLQLWQESPPAYVVGAIPLNWTTRETTGDFSKTAREWLNGTDAASGLLGASWLLLTPDAESAKRRLQRLSSDPNPLVRQLATTQLWRAVPPPETRSHLAKWMATRDRMLLPMQLGPTEFLADRLPRIGEPTLAIEQWLRIATVHDNRYHRAKAALKSVHDQLVRGEKQDEAEKVAGWIKQLESQKAPKQ